MQMSVCVEPFAIDGVPKTIIILKLNRYRKLAKRAVALSSPAVNRYIPMPGAESRTNVRNQPQTRKGGDRHHFREKPARSAGFQESG